jgi:hypothetical protein
MPLLDEWFRLRAQLEQQDGKVLDRLISAYGKSYSRLTPEIDALIEKMEADLASGKLTKETVAKSAAFKNLIREVDRELSDYSGYLKTEAATAADAAGRSGLSGGKLLMLAALADALGVGIADVPREAVKSAPPDALAFLADYLRKDGPLYQRIDGLSGYHAEQIAEGILERVAQGLNPREIAKDITDLYGMGLSDSLRMARTTQLYSYRQAERFVQVANADVLQGLVWCAELDDLTCLSCVALHGTVFPVGEICDDHHNGRCALLPWAVGAENPIGKTGEDWFKEQSEATQKSSMGESKYNAWKEDKFTFDKLSTTREDEVFGQMRGEASLKDIIGQEEAQTYYGGGTKESSISISDEIKVSDKSSEQILSDAQIYQSKHETEDMAFARKDYATDGYKEINSRLREGKPLGEDLEFISNQIDKGFISNPGISNDMIVYRGANIDASQLVPGATITDKSYVSTSLSKNEVASFARKGSDNPVIMEISLPQGSKIFSPSLAGDQFAYEKEVLLQKGSSFKVVEASKLNDIYTYVKLEYLK